MELALAVYEEITGTTPLPTVVGEDSDRRKHRRMPFGFRATILPTRRGVEGPASVVMIRDMSLAGISILNEDALKNGTVFTIEFKGQRERPVKIRCTAVRCEQGGTGGTQYVIGATFDELLTKELPPLPKEEPLPPLSDQSHIRGRLIKPDSEFAKHPASAADAMAGAAHSGPAPAAPFSVTSQPEPDQPMIEQTRIYGRLIRPNSEFEKAAVRDNPMSQLSDQAPISAKVAKPEAQPEIKAAIAPVTVPDDLTTAAKDPTTSAVVDEEAEALAMLLAEPDSSFEGFTLDDSEPTSSDDTRILEMLAEASNEKNAKAEPEPETSPSDQARILGRLTKSEVETEKKPALTAQAKSPEPAAKAAPKPEPATPPSDQARILGRLTKSEIEPEKKPAPKPEPVTPPADQARILSRLTKTESEPEKKPAPIAIAPTAVAPVAPPKAAEPSPKPAPAPVSQPAAKAPAKVETANPPSDQDRILSRLAKPEPETEKKPAPVASAPAAQKVQPAATKAEPIVKPEPVAKSEPIAKPTPKPEAAIPPGDQPKPAEKSTKTTSEPEIKRVPQVTASEDVAAAKPTVAKAPPAAPAAPAAPPWSNASKPTVPTEQKPVVISRSQGKGVNAMSLAHTESTSEQPAPAKTDVVTGVKALLLQQRETLKKQEHELETLRAELTQAKRKCAQLQAKADADAKAMTELEAFLTKETNDLAQGDNESIAA